MTKIRVMFTSKQLEIQDELLAMAVAEQLKRARLLSGFEGELANEVYEELFDMHMEIRAAMEMERPGRMRNA